MAWLHNLAGKAEDLLERIDKNAATVLNDANLILPENMDKSSNSYTDIDPSADDESLATDISILVDSTNIDNKDITIATEPSGFSDNMSIISEKSGLSDIEDVGLSFPSKQDSPSYSGKQDSKTEGGFNSKSSSLQNSFISLEDLPYKMEEKISKLELENESLNEQLINMRHIFAEIQNENFNLQNDLDRARQMLSITQTEMEQYRARTQRILQEKENLIALREVGTDLDASSNEHIMIAHNENLKKELRFQEERCNTLSKKLLKANSAFENIQSNFINMQKDEQVEKQKLHEFYNKEMNLLASVEVECLAKAKELQSVLEELAQYKNENAVKSLEIAHLKEQLKKRTSNLVNEDLELHLHSLTQTLMYKQDTLETITTERNALLLQLEKYEKQQIRLLSQLENSSMKSSRVNGTDDSRILIPQFLKISPFDAGVTRNVKRAYSSLDALSIRTGLFLRRYPIARVFVFSYMVLLHLWVLLILWTYIPSSSN